VRTVKLTMAYDGTEFAGWQRQKDQPSVQQTLEEALARVLHRKTVVLGAGRTDRGVHALGQVATFRTSARIPAERIPAALNVHLPPSVRVFEASDVPPRFHPCLSATGKHYRYTLLLEDKAPPLMRNFVVPVRFKLDLNAIVQAASHMVGRRDWRAFKTRAKGQEFYQTVKDVRALLLRKSGPFLLIDFLGSGFLYKQVRTMVGTLLEVGRGRFSPQQVAEILASGDRTRAGPTAPPHGLCLMQVFYGPVKPEWWETQGPAVWVLPPQSVEKHFVSADKGVETRGAP